MFPAQKEVHFTMLGSWHGASVPRGGSYRLFPSKVGMIWGLGTPLLEGRAQKPSFNPAPAKFASDASAGTQAANWG